MNEPSGLVVKMLTQHVRDLGLIPRWIHFFQLIIQVSKEKNIYHNNKPIALVSVIFGILYFYQCGLNYLGFFYLMLLH